MPHPAITVENLSKAYRIGLKIERHDSLVGAVQGMLRAPLKNWRRLSRLNTFKHQDESEDMFWALRDVSFEVAEGEVVGIIGRNGAGKSTLLKILSRITEPTSGRAVIRGRVSSLLEVGTGFHPELTGRDNVYMNGTILGMTKREIDGKFDEIVDFSGVEKFLDTPIKHYSSGMKVRLAFAVAAHLEPEILIIDEVLAVGDMEFQKKCLGKMQDVAKSGRTVLFVSHNMAAVESLCDTAIVLKNGMKAFDCIVADAVDKYVLDQTQDCRRSSRSARSACGTVAVNSVSVTIEHNDAIMNVEAELFERRPLVGLGCEIRTLRGVRVLSQGAIHNGSFVRNALGIVRFRLVFKELLKILNGGRYEIDIWLSHPGVEKFVRVDSAGSFDVDFKDPTRTGHALNAENHGPLFVELEAECEQAMNEHAIVEH